MIVTWPHLSALPYDDVISDEVTKCAGAVSSVVEHRLYTPGVTGSSPVPPTMIFVYLVYSRELIKPHRILG